MNLAKEETVTTCRLCLKNDENSVGIFDEIGLRDGLAVKIWRLCGFSVTTEDKMPTRICGMCLPQLETCVRFKSKVDDAQQKLHLSKLASTPYDTPSIISHSGALAVHSSPSQPSTYGWDTIQASNNCNLQTCISNNTVNSDSIQTPNKNTVTHRTIPDIPVLSANKSTEENMKEVTQLWNRFEVPQDYIMNVDEHMSTAILDHKYDDILSLCNMQDANGLIKQFPTEDMVNCTWSSDLVDDKKSNVVQLNCNKSVSDYTTLTTYNVSSVPLANNTPSTRNVSTQTTLTSRRSSTCSKPKSLLVTKKTSSKSGIATSVLNVDETTPKLEQMADSKNSAQDDSTSIPSPQLEENNVTVNRSTSNKYKFINKQLIDFYKMICQDCQLPCGSFAMLQRHTMGVHTKKAVVNCCGIQLDKRQSLIEHFETHFPTQDSRPDQLEVPSTTTPNLQNSATPVQHPPSPTPVDQNTDSDVYVTIQSPPSLLGGQEVTSSVILDGKEGNSSSQTGDIFKPQRCYSRRRMLGAQCPVCLKTLEWKSSLPKHLLTHGVDHPMEAVVDPTQCQFCKKTFQDEARKEYHVELHHPFKNNAKRRYPCNMCNTVLVSKSKLEDHWAVAHGLAMPGQSHNSPLLKAKERSRRSLKIRLGPLTKVASFKCLMCSKVYCTQQSVKRHMHRTHEKYEAAADEKRENEVDVVDN